MRSKVNDSPTFSLMIFTPSGASSSSLSAAIARTPVRASTWAAKDSGVTLPPVPFTSVKGCGVPPATVMRYSHPAVWNAMSLARMLMLYFPSSGSAAARLTVTAGAVAGAGRPSGRLAIGLVVGWAALNARLSVTLGAPDPVKAVRSVVSSASKPRAVCTTSGHASQYWVSLGVLRPMR